MLDRTKCVIIIFGHVPKTRRRLTMRQNWRLLLRRPGYVYHRLLLVFARIVTRSRDVHVAVEFDGVVISRRFGGDRVWPRIPYWLYHPGLTDYFIVPVNKYIDLQPFVNTEPKGPLPTMLRFFVSSRLHADDCVTLAVAVLREGGVNMTGPVVTPAQLRSELWRVAIEHGRIEQNGSSTSNIE